LNGHPHEKLKPFFPPHLNVWIHLLLFAFKYESNNLYYRSRISSMSAWTFLCMSPAVASLFLLKFSCLHCAFLLLITLEHTHIYKHKREREPELHFFRNPFVYKYTFYGNDTSIGKSHKWQNENYEGRCHIILSMTLDKY
jgi:hypothetical protein